MLVLDLVRALTYCYEFGRKPSNEMSCLLSSADHWGGARNCQNWNEREKSVGGKAGPKFMKAVDN